MSVFSHVSIRIAIAIIVSLVGYTWLNEKNQPPMLSVTKKETIREIDVEVVNTGGDTAESVQIMAELLINGKVTEIGEQQIDFLSSGEREEGVFIFSHNPRQVKLNLRVSSYKLP
ncbi:TIGR02588 family protein [Nostoc sp.]|uniref:TIGR02588 family protein n=1 Tax=Nostoc sp. TaxID=1180 RepID=UPI003FA60586